MLPPTPRMTHSNTPTSHPSTMHTTSSNTALQPTLLPPATSILPTTPAHSSISQTESPSSSFYPTMRYPLARATTPPSLLSYRSISVYQQPSHEGYKVNIID